MSTDRSSTPQIVTDHGAASRGNVWAAIWHVARGGGDVAVPNSRSDDPNEWAEAGRQALKNAAMCAREEQRWIAAARECEAMADHLHREQR